MSFNWEHYLSVAANLCETASEQGCEEAWQRAAISRAYYAAFHKAEEHLRNVENDVKLKQRSLNKRACHKDVQAGKIHRYIIDQFRQNCDPKRLQLAANLENLLDDRNEADYDDRTSYQNTLASKTTEIVETAKEIISSLPCIPKP